MYQSIEYWNNPKKISFPWNCANVLKFHTHYPEQHQPPIEQKPNAVGLFIYKQSTRIHTKLRHLARGRSEGKLSNLWCNKRKFWTHIPFSFHLIYTRIKNDKTLDSASVLISFRYIRKKKKNSSTKVDNANTCD